MADPDPRKSHPIPPSEFPEKAKENRVREHKRMRAEHTEMLRVLTRVKRDGYEGLLHSDLGEQVAACVAKASAQEY